MGEHLSYCRKESGEFKLSLNKVVSSNEATAANLLALSKRVEKHEDEQSKMKDKQYHLEMDQQKVLGSLSDVMRAFEGMLEEFKEARLESKEERERNKKFEDKTDNKFKILERIGWIVLIALTVATGGQIIDVITKFL